MVNYKQIADHLKKYYPESMLREGIISDIVAGMSKGSVADFKIAFDGYRNSDDFNASYPPTWQSLRKYLPTNIDRKEIHEKRLWAQFGIKIVMYGWAWGLRVGLDGGLGYDLKQMLIETGVAHLVPYTCFPNWFRDFCRILHSGDVSGAYDYAAQNAPEHLRADYRKKADSFHSRSNDLNKMYFPVLYRNIQNV